jgi:hypothetical protein
MSLNNIGKRIKWVRESLKLGQPDVVRATKIPLASYSGRENGIKATNIDEYLVLAMFFDEKWQEKKHQKTYNGIQIKKITPMFLMFGVYDYD